MSIGYFVENDESKIDSKLINYFFRRKRIMKSTGIVRKVDELGRVVIPIELRRTLGIAEKDALEIYVDDEKIILKNISQT